MPEPEKHNPSRDSIRARQIVDASLSGVIGTIVGGIALSWITSKGGIHELWLVASLPVLATMYLAFDRYLKLFNVESWPRGIIAQTVAQKDYSTLKRRLDSGRTVASLYERIVDKWLTAVDRYFGDFGASRLSRVGKAVGLEKPYPLWTAKSYDRSLFFALLYPIAMIFTIWMTTGHAGPAEAALGLPANLMGWQRGLIVLGTAGCAYSGFRMGKLSSGAQQALWAVPLLASAMAASAAGVSPIVVAIAGAGAFAAARSLEGAGVIAVGSFVAGSLWGPMAGVAAGGIFGGLCGGFSKTRLFGPVLTLMTAAFVVGVILVPQAVSDSPAWANQGPILLFLGLLTIINAPFDWVAIGLTRALIRRGVEKGRWWPIWYSFIDLLLALVLVFALAAVTLLAVQAFELTTMLGGASRPVVSVQGILAALANPSLQRQPEYWWLYTMLYASLIPSMINIAIGSWSLMRGIPWLNDIIAARLPINGGVAIHDRLWIAVVLSLQITLGAVIGVLAMLYIGWATFYWILPNVGVNTLSMLQNLAGLELPARLYELALRAL